MNVLTHNLVTDEWDYEEIETSLKLGLRAEVLGKKSTQVFYHNGKRWVLPFPNGAGKSQFARIDE
jgi:hypothetical protein